MPLAIYIIVAAVAYLVLGGTVGGWYAASIISKNKTPDEGFVFAVGAFWPAALAFYWFMLLPYRRAKRPKETKLPKAEVVK